MTLRLAGPLLLVGAGKMGGALLEGWLRQGLDPATVFIQDPAPAPEVFEDAAQLRWCQRCVVSPLSENWFSTSSPKRSSPFPIGLRHVRQPARPDFASSMMCAISFSRARRHIAPSLRNLPFGPFSPSSPRRFFRSSSYIW